MRSDLRERSQETRLTRRFVTPPVVLMMGLLGTAAGTPVAAAPERPINVESVRVGFVAGGQANLFKPGKWAPLWVQLRGGPARFSGVIEVVVPDDDGTPTTLRQAIDVQAGAVVPVTTYIRPGADHPELILRFFDAQGRRVAVVSGDSLVSLDSMRPEETLLVVLGKARGVELIPKLPGFSTDNDRAGSREINVARFDTLASSVPGRWIAYDAVEAIVLDTNDRDLMAKLNASGGQALREWVRRGGHLVVSIGSDWLRVRDSFLLAPDDPMLPALPTSRERVSDLGALESYAGATKPITRPGAPPVLVTKLEEVEQRRGKVLIGATGALPLVVRGTYGFGRVTVMALDVDQSPFDTWDDRALLWVKALDLRRQLVDESASSPGVAAAGRLYQNNVSDLSSQLRKSLEQFSGVTLIPFGWVAFFIFLYILLIGPGDYFFLKKVVKRMELTWITFPTIVVTVSVLAYYAAYAVKGSELRINQVEVVDVDQPSGLVRGSTFLTLFSPQNRDYDISVLPLPLDVEPAVADSTAAGDTALPRPPAGTEVILSWFGVPDPGFGGTGGNNQFRFASGGYSYEPPGAIEALADVRVPIWSTRSFTGRWFGAGPRAPIIESSLVPVGTDRLNGTVTNRLSVPLEDAHLAFGQQIYSLGTVAPGAAVRVELTQDRNLSGYLKANMARYLPEQPWSAQDFKISRADLLTALMFHDGGATATRENPVASIPLHYLDLTGQLALDRPMLFARIKRPATRLVIGRAPRPPRIERDTMLRAILPLEAAGDEPAGGEPRQ
jgi:hypothetical protein